MALPGQPLGDNICQVGQFENDKLVISNLKTGLAAAMTALEWIDKATEANEHAGLVAQAALAAESSKQQTEAIRKFIEHKKPVLAPRKQNQLKAESDLDSQKLSKKKER